MCWRTMTARARTPTSSTGTGGDQVSYANRTGPVTVDLPEDRIIGTERSDSIRDEGGENVISARRDTTGSAYTIGNGRLRIGLRHGPRRYAEHPLGAELRDAGAHVGRRGVRRLRTRALRPVSSCSDATRPQYRRREPFHCRSTLSIPSQTLARGTLRSGTVRRVGRLQVTPAARRLSCMARSPSRSRSEGPTYGHGVADHARPNRSTWRRSMPRSGIPRCSKLLGRACDLTTALSFPDTRLMMNGRKAVKR